MLKIFIKGLFVNTKTNLFVISSLILFTFLIMGVYKVGFYKTHDIKIKNDGSIYALSDRKNNKGTKYTHSVKNGVSNLNCEISNENKWPYCQIKINLMNKDHSTKKFDKGFDFSEYEQVFLKIKDVNNKNSRIRFYIRNYSSLYTNLDLDENSMKINEIEISPDFHPKGVLINLKDFNVASWWIRERKLSSQLQGIEFNNVPMLEIASGGAIEEGNFNITVSKIEFRKELITKEQLLFIIIGTWLLSGFVYLYLLLRIYRKQLKNSKLRNKQMKNIYKTLKIENNEIVKLAELAVRDELTGLKNRRGLTNDISDLEKAYLKNKKSFSVIFIDIDFFKKINDIHGHDAGDIILKEFSGLINDNIRINDSFARWGGEEFILLTPYDSLSAFQFADKLRVLIQNHLFTNDLQITASFGVSEHLSKSSIEDTFKKADAALYVSKSKGRNKVSIK